MSEPIWCTVNVKVPNSWNLPDGSPPAFFENFTYALINGVGPDSRETGKGWTIWQVAGEGNYGHHDNDCQNVLAALEEAGVPFQWIDDAKYEFTGEQGLFTGSEWVSRSCDENGITLSRYVFTDFKKQAAAEHLAGMGLWDALVVDKVDAWFNPKTLDSCPVDHLPATCPIFAEEEDD